MKRVHDKLVRDKIPAICRASGARPTTRIIEDDSEYLELLHAKLTEEAAELRETANLEELADVLEVLYAIGDHLGLEPEQIEHVRQQKVDDRGGFTGRVYLESTEQDD